jgi:hypothetical protein
MVVLSVEEGVEGVQQGGCKGKGDRGGEGHVQQGFEVLFHLGLSVLFHVEQMAIPDPGPLGGSVGQILAHEVGIGEIGTGIGGIKTHHDGTQMANSSGTVGKGSRRSGEGVDPTH